jgi:hypothetical protein
VGCGLWVWRGSDGDVEECLDLEEFRAGDSKDKSRMDAEESQTVSTFDVVEMFEGGRLS